MTKPAWSCTVTAEDGLLMLRFRPGLQAFAATPAAARALACKLLLVAEYAEQGSSGKQGHSVPDTPEATHVR